MHVMLIILEEIQRKFQKIFVWHIFYPSANPLIP